MAICESHGVFRVITPSRLIVYSDVSVECYASLLKPLAAYYSPQSHIKATQTEVYMKRTLYEHSVERFRVGAIPYSWFKSQPALAYLPLPPSRKIPG